MFLGLPLSGTILIGENANLNYKTNKWKSVLLGKTQIKKKSAPYKKSLQPHLRPELWR